MIRTALSIILSLLLVIPANATVIFKSNNSPTLLDINNGLQACKNEGLDSPNCKYHRYPGVVRKSGNLLIKPVAGNFVLHDALEPGVALPKVTAPRELIKAIKNKKKITIISFYKRDLPLFTFDNPVILASNEISSIIVPTSIVELAHQNSIKPEEMYVYVQEYSGKTNQQIQNDIEEQTFLISQYAKDIGITSADVKEDVDKLKKRIKELEAINANMPIDSTAVLKAAIEDYKKQIATLTEEKVRQALINESVRKSIESAVNQDYSVLHKFIGETDPAKRQAIIDANKDNKLLAAAIAKALTRLSQLSSVKVPTLKSIPSAPKAPVVDVNNLKIPNNLDNGLLLIEKLYQDKSLKTGVKWFDENKDISLIAKLADANSSYFKNVMKEHPSIKNLVIQEYDMNGVKTTTRALTSEELDLFLDKIYEYHNRCQVKCDKHTNPKSMQITIQAKGTDTKGNPISNWQHPIVTIGDVNTAAAYFEALSNLYIDWYSITVQHGLKYIYNIGYIDGYTLGFSIGWQKGFEEGFKQGYERGYKDGYNDGYADGYADGYKDGVNSVSEITGKK